MKNNLKVLTYTALMTAFVFLTTSIIKIPIPFTNGYIHAGDTTIFLSGILLGPFYGAIAAGVGSALADFLGGYAHWILPTLIIKSAMGFLIGYFSSDFRNQKHVLWGTIGIWIASVLGFIYTIRQTSIDAIVSQVEEASTVEVALKLIGSLNWQLLSVAIGLPLLSLILFKLKDKYSVSFNQLVGMIVAGIWMVLGYYVAAGIIYGNFMVPIFSIPWNIVQFGVGAILAFLIHSGLEKAHISYATIHSKS